MCKKKLNLESESLLAAEVRQKEAQYIQDPTTPNRRTWRDTQQSYRRLVLDKADKACFLSRCRGWEEGEKPGHMLAAVVKSQEKINFISPIRKIGGEITNDQN